MVKVRVKNTNAIRVKIKDGSTVASRIRVNNSGVKSLEDIGDVDEISVANGSTVVYNPDTDKYEIRKLDADDLDGDFNLDCGEF